MVLRRPIECTRILGKVPLDGRAALPLNSKSPFHGNLIAARNAIPLYAGRDWRPSSLRCHSAILRFER